MRTLSTSHWYLHYNSSDFLAAAILHHCTPIALGCFNPTMDNRFQPYAAVNRISNRVKATEFHQRVDRHGRPFGERISLSQDQAKPLHNKITPAPGEKSWRETGHKSPSQSTRERNLQIERQHTREDSCHKALPATTAGSNMVWREKRDSQRLPQRSPPPATFHTPRPVTHERMPEAPKFLDRNLADCDFPPLPRIPTIEEVMQKLVDVTIQYTNCADPVEREARRQRVLQTNSEGIMETTAVDNRNII
ncbi:hypothetical protein Bca52824_064780 [Brassica carinata]|uniref:Uncharacterized protein n=1 Tax=Brassica carinata TaxID=52824 RepID=A0A8X7U8I9_BRACI|nr:hypothetical protein Bca52824_064780 [Brassica carinata]